MEGRDSNRSIVLGNRLLPRLQIDLDNERKMTVESRKRKEGKGREDGKVDTRDEWEKMK